MKHLALTFAGVALLCAIAFGLSSCVADGTVDGGVYYGGYHDGPWMYGHDWYHHGNYHQGWVGAHPPRW